ncbi:hypothetical protein EVAR_99736_1 [Eumeta japonica]|uniref:Uncharacterized protein n=1 Tax=Eumeta variegata TaxID=151549 RepID=A0A4C1Z8L9_EUMVA|nr:hypothetical protein EVAR_99736_1 [Eumeta japonica]
MQLAAPAFRVSDPSGRPGRRVVEGATSWHVVASVALPGAEERRRATVHHARTERKDWNVKYNFEYHLISTYFIEKNLSLNPLITGKPATGHDIYRVRWQYKSYHSCLVGKRDVVALSAVQDHSPSTTHVLPPIEYTLPKYL